MKDDDIIFEKVDYEIFAEDMRKYNPKLTFTEERMHEIYDGIILPTKLRMEYEMLGYLYGFHSPMDYFFTENTNPDGSMDLFIPSGIKYMLTDSYLSGRCYKNSYIKDDSHDLYKSITIHNPPNETGYRYADVMPKYYEKYNADIILKLHLNKSNDNTLNTFNVEASDIIFYGEIINKEYADKIIAPINKILEIIKEASGF